MVEKSTNKDHAHQKYPQNGENNMELHIEEDNEDCEDADFEAINSQLDALNSILDGMEKKNDDIQAELLKLLKSNREIRAQLVEQNVAATSEDSKQQEN